jgi:hypothetical protein
MNEWWSSPTPISECYISERQKSRCDVRIRRGYQLYAVGYERRDKATFEGGQGSVVVYINPERVEDKKKNRMKTLANSMMLLFCLFLLWYVSIGITERRETELRHKQEDDVPSIHRCEFHSLRLKGVTGWGRKAKGKKEPSGKRPRKCKCTQFGRRNRLAAPVEWKSVFLFYWKNKYIKSLTRKKKGASISFSAGHYHHHLTA